MDKGPEILVVVLISMILALIVVSLLVGQSEGFEELVTDQQSGAEQDISDARGQIGNSEEESNDVECTGLSPSECENTQGCEVVDEYHNICGES